MRLLHDVDAKAAGKVWPWYQKGEFPLLPRVEIRKKSEHNTWGMTFTWLFFRFWTLDNVDFELAIVASTHWGIGVIGILPYLRWKFTIPCHYKIGMWWDKLTRRKE